MEPRIDYRTVARGAMQAMGRLEVYARHSGIEPSLLELARLRASQINGWPGSINCQAGAAKEGMG